MLTAMRPSALLPLLLASLLLALGTASAAGTGRKLMRPRDQAMQASREAELQAAMLQEQADWVAQEQAKIAQQQQVGRGCAAPLAWVPVLKGVDAWPAWVWLVGGGSRGTA